MRTSKLGVAEIASKTPKSVRCKPWQTPEWVQGVDLWLKTTARTHNSPFYFIMFVLGVLIVVFLVLWGLGGVCFAIYKACFQPFCNSYTLLELPALALALHA